MLVVYLTSSNYDQLGNDGSMALRWKYEVHQRRLETNLKSEKNKNREKRDITLSSEINNLRNSVYDPSCM